MIDIQESIEENAADQQLRACLPYITEGLGKKNLVLDLSVQSN